MENTSPVTKQIVANENYRPLKEDEEYLLFLYVFKPSSDGEYGDLITPLSSYQSKYPLKEKLITANDNDKLTPDDFELGNRLNSDMFADCKSIAKKVYKKCK